MTSALLPPNLVFRAFAQTGTPAPLAGGKLTFFQAGTSTPQAVYSDATGTVPLGSTLTLDVNGQASFWLKSGLTYKINLTDAQGVQQAGWPVDNVAADPAFSETSALSYNLASSSGGSAGASLVGFNAGWASEVGRTVNSKLSDSVSVLDFGADPTGVSFSTTAILEAIQSLRSNPVTILDTIGGGNITAYSSGTVLFPPGLYKIAPDTLQICQDLGLTFKGSGSRRTNNAVQAATTILISGTSSGYGIQCYRSGGRGFHMEDLDLVYASSSFTGAVLDVYDCPGVTATRCMIGTAGLTNATRIQSASGCVRATYDEFLTFNDCVFDGAQYGFWSDDLRTFSGNTFGGSCTLFESCVFYDFSYEHIWHAGNRTRTGLTLINCAFNPISISPQRCVDVSNVIGFEWIGGICTASTTYAPSAEWCRVGSSSGGQVSGSIRSVSFSDLASAGTLNGFLSLVSVNIYCTNGFTLQSGIISSKGCEVSKATTGFIISQFGSNQLCLDLGPDLFKGAVTCSYVCAAESSLLSGRINYDSASDNSSNKFGSVSQRINILNVDSKNFSVASDTYTISITDTGRTIQATGSVNQVFTLPTPTPGTKLCVNKLSSQTLSVACPSGVKLYSGQGAVKSTASVAAADIGGSITLEAYGTVGWLVKGLTGTWTLS